MSSHDLIQRRLRNQRLVDSTCRSAAEVVAQLAAVQSQDYPAAKWGLGQRVNGLTDADVERAFNAGEFLRTHILRPTWHFVPARDIRWMLSLSAPRVHRFNGTYYRKYELDSTTLARSRRVLVKALQRGTFLTRAELAAALADARITAAAQRLALLVMHAELEGVVCSGPRLGNQSTYALLDERAPGARVLPKDEALAELTRRYFRGHGPATLRDYVWWSGLTVGDARRGIDIAGRDLVSETHAGLTFWSAGTSNTRAVKTAPCAHLLPNYDEFLIAYKDRGLSVPARSHKHTYLARDAFAHYAIVDGQLTGTWRREARGKSVVVHVATYNRATRATTALVKAAAMRYGTFLQQPVSRINF